MSKKEIKKVIFVGLIIAIILAAIFTTLALIQPAKRTTKATRYDLGCTTELREKPLQECKK